MQRPRRSMTPGLHFVQGLVLSARARATWGAEAPASASLRTRPRCRATRRWRRACADRAPPKQQFVVRPVAVDLEEVDDGAVGLDDADAVLDRRRDVVAAVGVDAEPVATARPERLDDPLARARRVRRAAARALRRRRRRRRGRTRCRCSSGTRRANTSTRPSRSQHHHAADGLGRRGVMRRDR